MTESSLVPEQPLVFSPGLAATIGLEEAVLLQYLHGLFRHREAQRRGGRAWLRVEREHLLRNLPFWSSGDLARIARSLADKGVLLLESSPSPADDALLFALDEGPAAAPAHQGAPAPAPHPQAGLLPAGWAPSEDLLQLLALNHNIPRQFALDQLEDFILYWRERGETSHAWESKFRQHVLSNWRRSQQQAGEAFRPPQRPLDRHWRPSADAMEILLRAGVARDFIEEAIPEFILYWRERGSPPKELNTRFVQHVRQQWTRYSASLEHSTEPRRIAEDWRPSEDALDILRLSHIDRDFALGLLPEFVLYWRDSNQLHTSWNSKFLQHVKYHWARHNQLIDRESRHDGQQGTLGAGRTRDRSLEQDLSDTSWAE
jgi:hypothetical protein